MIETPDVDTPADDAPSLIPIVISVIVLFGFVLTWWLARTNPGTGWLLPYRFCQVALISVVIWQACDPFADTAQWIGDVFQLPGSVRGATLDAIASSMPELFSGIFFVIVAISAASGGNEADIINAGAEGYGSTIATCAGSAIYNMILIPAFCALVISYTRHARPTIDIDDEVVTRDGLWFVGCSVLLIVFLFNDTMDWWMALVFLGLYAAYIFQLYRHAVAHRACAAALETYFQTHGADTRDGVVIAAMNDDGHLLTTGSLQQARNRYRRGQEIDEELPDCDPTHESAGLFFGYVDVPLNRMSAAVILLVSTLVAAIACYFLVEATLGTARSLHVPAFFVAVILAAAASSVPDTFLAIAAAKRGDDSGAVSNAFGSNIFDICICLSIPLLVNSYLTGWQPVSLLQDGRPIPGLTGLRILMVVLTIVTLAIMWHNRQLTRTKAFALCGLYLVFIAYAVLGSLGVIF